MLRKLKYWLQPTDKIFADFAKNTLDRWDKNKRRIFIDRGSSVLFVAHVDTVQSPKFKRRTKKRIYAQGLDDRLGCLIACELSEQLGADLLLTDHEEVCASTAQHHTCKQYNWVAEFDREGGDVVTYGLDNPGFTKTLEDHFKIGMGSYSDICDLKTSACCVNVGIGYEFAHGKDSYVCIGTMQNQINRFLAFYEQNKNVTYIRQAKSNNWLDSWDDCNNKCDVCGIYGAEPIHGYYICEDCFCRMFDGVLV